MKKIIRHPFVTLILLIAITLLAYFLVSIALGDNGLMGNFFTTHTTLKFLIYYILMTHFTITAMSLCFHRMHTHQGVQLHTWVDRSMQIWLWFTTSMSKQDWVSIHAYHHAHSDQDLDPHSPIKKGFFHVLLMGAIDYTKAKNNPDVLKIRKRIPVNQLESFIDTHLFLGPILFGATSMILFGPNYGILLFLLTFSISPVFAVGGVNALAHWWGYKNYKTTDNSRNVGFLFILNWMICGELDHNNHHAHPKSCSFRHRWFEFDVGYLYIQVLQSLGLAKIIHAAKVRPHIKTQHAPAAQIHS